MATLSATPAVHFLRRHAVAFTEHPYRYEEHGGTRVSSRELGVDEHAVIKTLVMQDEAKRPLLVLMHGDRDVSTKQLARKPLPVYVERTVLDLDRIYINGGRRGLLVSIAPGELIRVLNAVAVDAALSA